MNSLCVSPSRATCAWFAGLALASTALWAQSAPPIAAPAAGSSAAGQPVKLQAFTVTGSNLKRLDVERVLPVTVFDAEQIDIRDASQPSDLLTALPQVTGLPGNETATLGATARGDNATVSLRALPSSDTLVLLNGRRVAPHPISQSEAGTPTLSTNINTLPNRGLDRIEVLRDGASSIYGTDAVAGVVNYVTRRQFRGTELALRFGETKYGDGQEYRATLTHGFDFAGNRGRAMITADYFHRQATFARERDFMAESDLSYRAPAPWNVPTSTTFNARSATTEYGNFLLGTVTATDEFGNVTDFSRKRPAGVLASLASSTGAFVLQPDASGGVAFGTASPSRAGVTHDYYWNNNAYRVLQPQTARTSVFASGEYDLGPRITAFADFSLYQAQSITYREPDGITQSTDGYIIVPATNPWNPFGTRFWDPAGRPNADGSPRLAGTPSAVSITNKRLGDLATRTDYVDNNVYRGVAGVRGRVFDSWQWEAALLYSTDHAIENEEGPTRKSLLQAAIDQTDPAKAFNPFTRTFAVQNNTIVVTGDYVNPESVQQTFRSSFIRQGLTKLGSVDFRASGDVARLWGGNTIGGAFGGEFRDEGYDDYRPPFAGLNPPGSGLDPTTNDFLGFSPNSDTHGNRHVSAVYAETVVPLVGREFTLPLVQSLELTASARYERYSDFGAATKPKYGVSWKPVSWILVRASYNEGFHAPNLAQLFTGSLVRTQTGVTDSYRSTVTGQIVDGASNRRALASGNRALRPETSVGKSAGVVIDVPHVKGLSVSVDYWEIRQKDVITAPTATESVNRDRDALFAATQAALANGAAMGAIDLGSGGGTYQGDPAIVRLPVTQADRDAFAAYNAQQAPGNQRAVVGAIDHILISYFNRAQQFVNGFDFDVNYRLPPLAIGSFDFDMAWTYLVDCHAYNAPGELRTELRATNSFAIGGADPAWRGSATLTWRRKQWSAALGFYYIGRYTDSGATTSLAQYTDLGRPAYLTPVFSDGGYTYRYTVHDSKTYNASVSYRFAAQNRWLNDTTVRLGVVNLFNAKPPLSSDSRGYDPAVYNVMAKGLTWSVQLTKKL